MQLTEKYLNQQIRKAISGGRKAQKELYKAYASAMYNTALRIVGRKQDAEDVLQNAFIKAFCKLDSFKGKSTFGAWLKRIVINEAISFKRKRKDFEEALDDQSYDAIADESTFIPQYSVSSISASMKELSSGYRQVLSLYLFEGYDHEEISKILGVSISTSKTQYMRAKKKLEQIIKSRSWMN